MVMERWEDREGNSMVKQRLWVRGKWGSRKRRKG